MHTPELAELLYVPAGQMVQGPPLGPLKLAAHTHWVWLTEPVDTVTLLGGHAVQLLVGVALNVLSGQRLHVDAPGRLKEPAGHGWHALLLTPDLTVPAGQMVQLMTLPASE
jgi:hypothetical protein